MFSIAFCSYVNLTGITAGAYKGGGKAYPLSFARCLWLCRRWNGWCHGFDYNWSAGKCFILTVREQCSTQSSLTANTDWTHYDAALCRQSGKKGYHIRDALSNM